MYTLLWAVAVRNWEYELSRGTEFPTRQHVRPVKTQIRLRISAVWSESSQGTLCSFPTDRSKVLPLLQFFVRVSVVHPHPLRKHAYSNILKILPSNNENFRINNSDIFHISAQSIDCGYTLEPPRRGGSNEYPQSMFLSRDKKNNVYPYKRQFYNMKVGFKGVKII